MPTMPGTGFHIGPSFSKPDRRRQSKVARDVGKLMCGLAGILATGDSGPRLLKEMATSLAHRGPDDEGLWWDPTSRVGLAHRRLAVVDLSPAGHQPMLSSDGRFVLAFNGEIYNHRA